MGVTLHPATSDKAVPLTMLQTIGVLDVIRQEAGLLVVGLFKKACDMVWADSAWRKRILVDVSNGDVNLIKTSCAAMSAITKESGIAQKLGEAGVFDGAPTLQERWSR